MDRRLAVALTLAALGTSPDSRWRVGLRSYGPIEFGMPFDKACERLGAQTCAGWRSASDAAESCRTWTPFRGDSISFMVEDDRVVRVDVSKGDTRTRSGLGIGSSEEDVKRAYAGRITVAPQKYAGEPSHTLTYVPAERSDAAFRVVFETDGAVVGVFRAGVLPAVEYVEGCL